MKQGGLRQGEWQSQSPPVMYLLLNAISKGGDHSQGPKTKDGRETIFRTRHQQRLLSLRNRVQEEVHHRGTSRLPLPLSQTPLFHFSIENYCKRLSFFFEYFSIG